MGARAHDDIPYCFDWTLSERRKMCAVEMLKNYIVYTLVAVKIFINHLLLYSVYIWYHLI